MCIAIASQILLECCCYLTLVEWKRGARQPRGVKIIGRKVVMAGRGTYNARWEEKKLSIWYQSLIPAPCLNS